MSFEFKFPDVGEGIHEGEIVRWRVKVGDIIKEDQPIAEVETAKAIVEIPSPKSGTVIALVGKEGQTIHVGDVLAVIGEKGETWEPAKTAPTQVPQASAQEGATQTEAEKAVASAGPGVIGRIPTEEKGVVLPPRGAAIDRTSTLVLPRTRKLAQDLKVDLSKVKGSGPGGQITELDIQNASAAASGPAPESFGVVERVPVKGVRKAVAEHMVRALFSIPHVTHMDECDVSALVKLRESQKPEAEKHGVKLTYLSFIIKAVCEALKKFPGMNAEYRDMGGGTDKMQPEIIFKKYYNIGIAVDTPEGLMVPVIRDADKKDIFVLAKEITDLAEKCRTRKISADELSGGSFNITNIGSVGGIFATPVIAVGQSAVLGTMRMKEKPLAVDGKVEIRPVLSLALSFDHRVVDGADAARFMNEIMANLSVTKS